VAYPEYCCEHCKEEFGCEYCAIDISGYDTEKLHYAEDFVFCSRGCLNGFKHDHTSA